jgi:hypothetical protein
MQCNEYFDLCKVFTEAYETFTKKNWNVLEFSIILGDEGCYMSKLCYLLSKILLWSFDWFLL